MMVVSSVARRLPRGFAKAASVSLLAALGIAGCGQKGPLMLPAAATPASAASAAR
jgi:predicted small lipoprotein YifL